MEFWKKNLIVIWICQFLAMVGMSAVVPFLPLYIRHLGVTDIDATAQWSGLIFAGPFLLSFFFTPLWGSMGDRVGRKLMTIRATFGLGLALIMAGLSQNVTHLLLARMLQGALSGFLPSAMALVASNTPREKTGYALGLLQSATAAGNVMGPFIGGVLADIVGYREVFYFMSALLFLTGIFIIFFVKEFNKVDRTTEGSSLWGNWKYMLNSRKLRMIAILISLANLGLAFIRPIYVLYIESFGIGDKFFGTITGSIFGIIGIFTTISAAWWGRKSTQYGFRKSLMISASITSLMYISQVFIYNIYMLVPVNAVLGFCYGALNPLLFTMISNNTPDERKGGIIGVATSFQVLGNFFGPLGSGMFTSIFGLRIPFLITGIIFLIITLSAERKIR